MINLSFIRKIVDRGLHKAKIPGAAVTVVKNGDILYCQGFGVKESENKLPVDSDTRFLICSLTKGFTSLSALLLAQDGRLRLDEPIHNYIPGFKLNDSYASSRSTLRDFLTHVSGLPSHDAIWMYNPSITRHELVRRMAFLEPSASLRSRWQYNNLGYTMVGCAVEEAAGICFESFIEKRILKELGIYGSFLIPPDHAGNYAVPYMYKESAFRPISYSSCSAMGPAGTSLQCSIKDMAKWMQFNLGTGYGGGLLGESYLKEMHHPFVALPKVGGYLSKFTKSKSYCLGWFSEIYQGHQHLFHDGGYPGFSSFISLFPEKGLGVAVLSNTTSTFPVVTALSIAEAILGLHRLHWHKDIYCVQESSVVSGMIKRNSSLLLQDYNGEYSNKAYGTLSIRTENSKVFLDYYGLVMELNHLKNEEFMGIFRDEIAKAQIFGIVYFSCDSNNTVYKVNVPFEPSVKPIEFIRVK